MSDHHKSKSILHDSPVVVFVNSEAGGGRAPDYVARIQKVFESLQIQAQFVVTNSAADLEASAQTAILQGQRILFAMGGDGTFQALANAAFGADVLLSVLPFGGGNDFAAAIGLPDDPVKAAEAILRGSVGFVDLVRVRTAEGRTRLYAGGGGIGLDAEAALYASGAYRRFPGRMRYIASALRALASFKPLEVRIEFPESKIIPHQGNALLAAVLNTPTYGAGLRLAPSAVLDDGSLDVVLIEDIGTLRVLQLLLHLMGSGELRTSRVKRWKTPRVRLTSNRGCLFHGDGEIMGTTPVDIEVVHRAIQVLLPVNDGIERSAGDMPL
jgi:YegS/Rv2252/BmrU family lipid kinase